VAGSCVRGDPFGLYAQLARARSGAHNAYLDLGRHVIASASPELFLDWDGDLLRTRPMKRTAARGRTPQDDVRHGEQLRSSPEGAGREPDDRRPAAQRPLAWPGSAPSTSRSCSSWSDTPRSGS
jgi:hypothetical protein